MQCVRPVGVEMIRSNATTSYAGYDCDVKLWARTPRFLLELLSSTINSTVLPTRLHMGCEEKLVAYIETGPNRGKVSKEVKRSQLVPRSSNLAQQHSSRRYLSP
jgi:hypothetical protein